MKRIAIVGEFSKDKITHRMLNENLEWLKEKYFFDYEWIGTEELLGDYSKKLGLYSGIWSAPGSPFKSLQGALNAIKYARENNIPHLACCGGFQHTIIEYVRNVLGIKDASHEEYDNNGENIFIKRLTCSLRGKSMKVKLMENSIVKGVYEKVEVVEDYYCSFAINDKYRSILEKSELIFSGLDEDNEIRILELKNHPFFIGTLFVPQSQSKKDNIHPLIESFVKNIFV